jgi:hypothetical protein
VPQQAQRELDREWIRVQALRCAPEAAYATGRPAPPEVAISLAICITVRQASVNSPYRDMARAM